jgi:regulatory protein
LSEREKINVITIKTTMDQKNIGVEKALQKARHFCSYQERSHTEVKEKLYSFGLYKKEVEQLLSQLIEDNYLNEERFAIAFAGGKFRIKQWGKTKIRYELQQKRVSDYCIKTALNAIDSNKYVLQQKVRAYLTQKGYESGLITELIHKMG